MKQIQEGFSDGLVTKDDFEKALRAHKEAKDEEKSEQRETASAYISQNPSRSNFSMGIEINHVELHSTYTYNTCFTSNMSGFELSHLNFAYFYCVAAR